MQKVKLSSFDYPALASNYAMASALLMIAIVLALAVFIHPEAFSLLSEGSDAVTLPAKLALLATLLKALGIIAPLTKITQPWQLRKLRKAMAAEGKLLSVRYTFKGAVIMGFLLSAAGNAINLYLGGEVHPPALLAALLPLLFVFF